MSTQHKTGEGNRPAITSISFHLQAQEPEYVVDEEDGGTRTSQSLIYIDLEDCDQLQVLCSNFGCLSSLKGLDLRGCESLVKLPESFSELSSLETLELSGCKQLDKLPSSISKLKKLGILTMKRTGIRELPEDFGLV